MAEKHSTVEYRDIPGFPGYRVGSDGSIWSAWTRIPIPYRKGTKSFIGTKWKRLSTCLQGNGYISACLCGSGKQVTKNVHRLVLESFIGPCPNGKESRHLDGNKRNNNLDNLCYGTRHENSLDMDRHGTRMRGARHYKAILSESDVIEIRKLRAAGIGCTPIARRFGVKKTTIQKISQGKIWKSIT